MAWTIEYSHPAVGQLRRLDRQVARRIVDFLDHRIAVHPNPPALAETLSGRPDLSCFRVGDYRIVCALDRARQRVRVVAIGHRRDVYR